jgi:hypothetical protein
MLQDFSYFNFSNENDSPEKHLNRIKLFIFIKKQAKRYPNNSQINEKDLEKMVMPHYQIYI